MSDSEYEPVVVSFCCNWCAYAGADAAGTAKMQYPSNIHIIRILCSGMLHPNVVMESLKNGADGVLVCGCHPGDCHYQDGNLRAEQRAEAIQLLLEDYGLEPERFRLEWVSAAEGPRFAKIANEMVATLKELGPNPLKA